MNQTPGIPCDSDPSALSIEEARIRIFAALKPLRDTETINSNAALGRISGTDIVSPIEVPSFRASAMDGFAVRVEECREKLTIAGASLAGHPGSDLLAPGTCQRITTGARVPDTANAVVQQENVTVIGNAIEVNSIPGMGNHIREPGTDSEANSILITRNSRIGAAEIALLAAHGITKIPVFRPLKITLFSTGDELVEPGIKRRSGQIYDANRPLLQSLLASASVKVIDSGIVPDSASALKNHIEAAADTDLILSSGGVSVGDADHVKAVLDSMGSVNLWKIAMKPGRPLTFGFTDKNIPFFGLPGNPVSAALTCLLFVRPAIDHLLGIQYSPLPPLSLTLDGELNKIPGRVEYQRAVIQKREHEGWVVSTTGIQDSHVLTSLHKANCLIELPVDSSGASHGEKVTVYPFTHFASNAL